MYSEGMQPHTKNRFVQDSWQAARNARILPHSMALRNREIGQRLSALREARGNPPQEIVAQKLEVANRSYQSWEAGDTRPSWRNLQKLAAYYGTTEEFLLLGEEVQSIASEPTRLDQLEQQIEALAELVQLMRAEGQTAVAAVLRRIDVEPDPTVQVQRRRRA